MLKFDTSRKRFFGFILLGWILLILSDRIGELRQYQGAFVAMYALAIASIILLTGYSGQLSLGHSALMAVGAYAGALSINNLKLHPAIALIICSASCWIIWIITWLCSSALKWSISCRNNPSFSSLTTNDCKSISNFRWRARINIWYWCTSCQIGWRFFFISMVFLD